VRAMLPPAIVRTYLADKDAAVHLAVSVSDPVGYG
jgi:hypothetical protein